GASTSQRQALQQDVKRLTARYLKGVPVDVAALQARGFQQLELMPDTQGKVVTAASFKGLVVTQSRQSPPFVLSPDEWNAIQDISTVLPRNLPGSTPLAQSVLQEYRQKVLARLADNNAEHLRLHAVV